MADVGVRRVEICENNADLASKLCDFVINKANTAIAERGIFTVGLSGEVSPPKED